jgi:hypothetical protein
MGRQGLDQAGAGGADAAILVQFRQFIGDDTGAGKTYIRRAGRRKVSQGGKFFYFAPGVWSGHGLVHYCLGSRHRNDYRLLLLRIPEGSVQTIAL